MSTDKEHLQWIYDRLTYEHSEPANVDYMLRFREIIDGFPCKGAGVASGPNDWAQQHEADKSNYGLAGFLKEKSASPAGLTPEHSARPWASDGYPEVVSAYRYVDSVVQTADVMTVGGHAWHGWALREAFLAGCTHHREHGGYIVPTLPARDFEDGLKEGSAAAVKGIQMALKNSWRFRLGMRISPLVVMQRVGKLIEEQFPLQSQTGSEGLPADHSSELYPLG